MAAFFAEVEELSPTDVESVRLLVELVVVANRDFNAGSAHNEGYGDSLISRLVEEGSTYGDNERWQKPG